MPRTNNFIKIIALDWSYTLYNRDTKKLYHEDKLRQFCLDAEKSGRKVVIVSTTHDANSEVLQTLDAAFGVDREFLLDDAVYTHGLIKRLSKDGVKFEKHRSKLTLLNVIRDDYRADNNGRLISTSQVAYCDDDPAHRQRARNAGYFVFEFDSVEDGFLSTVSSFIANKETIRINEVMELHRSGNQYKQLVAEYHLFDEINCLITNFMQNTNLMHDLKIRHTVLTVTLLKKVKFYQDRLRVSQLSEFSKVGTESITDTNALSALTSAQRAVYEFQRTTKISLDIILNKIRLLNQRADDENTYEKAERIEIEKLDNLLNTDQALWNRSLDELDIRLQDLKTHHAIQSQIMSSGGSSLYERKVASDARNELQTKIDSCQCEIDNLKKSIGTECATRQKEIYERGLRLSQTKLSDADVLYNVFHYAGATCNRTENGRIAKTLIDYLDAFTDIGLTPTVVNCNQIRVTKAFTELYAAINWAAKSLIILTDPQGGIDRGLNSVQQAITSGQRLAETRDPLNLSAQYDLFKESLGGLVPLIDAVIMLLGINKNALISPCSNKVWDNVKACSSSGCANVSSSFWNDPIKEYLKKVQGYDAAISKLTEFKERIVNYSKGLENLSVDQIYEHNQMIGKNPSPVMASNSGR